LLLAAAAAFCEANITVLRCDLPFRQERRFGPPFPAQAARDREGLRCDLPFRQERRFGPPFPAQAARDREGLRCAVALMRERAERRLFLGGHSYGGRQATMLVTENALPVDGLLLLSYPLHPPRRPEQVRTAHFPKLHTRALFVHGTRDPFGSLDEVRVALALIHAETRLVSIEGAGHELLPRNPAAAAQFAQQVVKAFSEFSKI
jgi:predicted alpha/beta-hydrolase family hydrolase